MTEDGMVGWHYRLNGHEFGPLGGTRRVGGLLGVAGRLSGTVSPFGAEQGTSLETPSRARASSCQAVAAGRPKSLALRLPFALTCRSGQRAAPLLGGLKN